jgi:hypothetical protein
VPPETRGSDGRAACRDLLRTGTTVTTIAVAAINAIMRTSVFTSRTSYQEPTELSCRRERGRDGLTLGNTLFKKAPV